MTATQGMLKTNIEIADSTSSSEARDTLTRTRGLSRAAAALDETAKTQIFRQWRRGVSVDVLAGQSGLSRTQMTRVINEIRRSVSWRPSSKEKRMNNIVIKYNDKEK